MKGWAEAATSSPSDLRRRSLSRQGDQEMLVAALADFEATMLFVTSPLPGGPREPDHRTAPPGVHQCGGGSMEYMVRMGKEAPGLHPG